MKILMVSFALTHPTQMGNQQRIYRECVQMRKRGWQIDFLYLGNAYNASVEMTREFFGENHFYQCFLGQRSIKTRVKKQIRSYMDQKGISKYVALKYSTDEWYVDGIADKVNELQDKNSYDVIWYQYFFYSKALEKLHDTAVFKVIDTHDRWADRNKIFQKKGAVPEFFYTSKRGERKALRRADVVIAIQEKEGKYFQRLLKGTDAKVLTVGDLVVQRESVKCNQPCYGMIGAINPPNIIGLDWFCKEVLPLVRAKRPDSCFVLAGGICDRIPDIPGIRKLGRVNRLEDFYNSIKFAINPVQNGTGLNIKTIEALAFGKALVSTEVGAKGIESDKEVLVKCDGAQEFADAVIKLLLEDEVCDELSRNAQEYIVGYNKKNVEALYSIEELCR